MGRVKSATEGDLVIGKVISAGLALLSALSIVSLSVPAAEASAGPTCQALFESKTPAAAAPVDENRFAFKPRITIDPKTGQRRVERFVPTREGREVFVDFLEPEPGKTVIVLDNGLTYRTAIWDAFVEHLKGEGLGILRFDPQGMGKTMERYGALQKPVTIAEQVEDQKALLDNLGIDKIHQLGLSYGGGMSYMFTAMYPNRVLSLIPISAYTGPLEGQVRQIQTEIAMTRTFNPFVKATDAELYSFFLKQIVYATYPLSEPIVLEHPYKLQSVFYLADGATSFNAEDFVGALPDGILFQIDARRDQYIALSVPTKFWSKVPTRARASRIIVDRAEHKVVEQMPELMALIVKKIIYRRDPRLLEGRTWDASNFSDTLRNGSDRIDLKK